MLALLLVVLHSQTKITITMLQVDSTARCSSVNLLQLKSPPLSLPGCHLGAVHGSQRYKYGITNLWTFGRPLQCHNDRAAHLSARSYSYTAASAGGGVVVWTWHPQLEVMQLRIHPKPYATAAQQSRPGPPSPPASACGSSAARSG